MKKVKRPGRIGRCPLCIAASARRGAWGERGKSSLHPRTPLCAGTRSLSLELGGAVPPLRASPFSTLKRSKPDLGMAAFIGAAVRLVFTETASPGQS